MAATDLLWRHYPTTLTGGRLSQIRESLVNNARLAAFARGYGFDRRLAANLAQTHVSAAAWTKVLGDVFEAYVGALALEDAGTTQRRAEEWLEALWRPLLPGADAFGEEDEAAQDAVKQRAARTFAPSGSGLKAYYEDLAPVVMENKAQQRHTVGFFVKGWEFEGLKLGEGVGQNKKSAKTRAAKDALERVERGDEVLVGLVERVEKYVAEKKAAREEAERAKEAEGDGAEA
ncbi:Nucleolar RNAse [Neofusicoccum parvum]|uniref:Nucleolar RNAse n=1 Tax=Neofusicoccum parvum TaxID=310453 RepID=A0ACB5RQY7_9PEZI|nr:Nucleolar RNAse [Neofusicoccum parvum]